MKLRYSSSHLEGGIRRWSIVTKEFLGENSQGIGAKIREVDWLYDQNGMPSKMVERQNSEQIIEANLVLLALGFIGPKRNKLLDDLGIKFNSKGTINYDENSMTEVEGVFVAGDMAHGASLVVRAIADGRRCAEGILRYLKVC